ncbi:hypothetical protein ACFLTJ_01450 [Chloroflexota bacterium]
MNFLDSKKHEVTHYFSENSSVRLEAKPKQGFEFSGWGGDLSGCNNPIIINITSDMSITVNFASQGVTTGETSRKAGITE